MIVFLLFLVGISIQAQAYPEFIGYGYSSCLTCHFNGHGSGALNDYGRALWSGEIASRKWSSSTVSDEEIAEKSGFFGKAAIPWWIRPAIKYRSLYLRKDFGSPRASEKNYYMQADLNLVLRLSQEDKYILYFTEGFRPNAQSDPSRRIDRWMPREYWARIQMGETYWLYAGLMDKVFGLRNIDHTSYTRIFQKLSQTDQSLGLVLHKIEPGWEVSAQYFTGNPDEEKETKQVGYSLMYEKEFAEKIRGSVSYLNSKSDVDLYSLYAVSFRMGLSKGSSLMAEYGVRQNTLVATNILKQGSWTALHSFVELSRGYNFHSSIERYNEEFKPSAPDLWRWTLGFVMFPAPRLEIRTDLVSKREISEVGARDDNWALQGQVHVSL